MSSSAVKNSRWFKTYGKISTDFETKHPFESFLPKQSEMCEAIVLKAINEGIIKILRDTLASNLQLDIAFLQINILLHYAADDIYEQIPNCRTDVYMNYYKFLFYFLLFGCCLGTKYSKCMVFPPNYKNNEILSYFIDEYVPKMNKSHIKYKYCGAQRDAIIKGVTAYTIPHGIALLISDFTAYAFEAFLFEVMQIFHCYTTLPNCVRTKQLWRLWNSYGFGRGAYITFMIQKCLLASRFIHQNDDNLRYFCNQMLFKSIVWHSSIHRTDAICCLFAYHCSIKPWTDSIGFIELFESYRDYLSQSDEYMMDIFEQCVAVREACPVSIFYNGNNEKRYDFTVDYKEIACINTTIDYLLHEWIIKYCIRMNKTNIVNTLFYQIMNCMMYFMDKDLWKSNEILMDKLANIKELMCKHCDFTAFVKDSKCIETLNLYRNHAVRAKKNKRKCSDIDSFATKRAKLS